MASAGADLHRRHCDRKRRGATSAEYRRPRDRFRHRQAPTRGCLSQPQRTRNGSAADLPADCSFPMGAVALARVPLAGLKVASRAPYLDGIDTAEIIDTVHNRRPPMISTGAGLMI